MLLYLSKKGNIKHANQKKFQNTISYSDVTKANPTLLDDRF